MTRDQLIIILLIAMAVVLAAELLYILFKKKRRRQEMSMFRKREAEEEPLGDRAHNAVLTTESICKTLAGQGANTAEAESIISEARRQLERRNYAEAIERAEAAKMSLLRAKREMETDTPPLDDGDDMPEPLPPEPKEEVKKDSLPTNFMQAKFMIATTKDLLERRGITSGQAHDLYKDAIRLFGSGDYTQALSCAVKAGKLLDSDTLSLIGQETHPGETVEVLVCPSCEKEISDDDVFCRECGQNLAAAQECPGCGNAVETSDKFCRKCGTKLR